MRSRGSPPGGTHRPEIAYRVGAGLNTVKTHLKTCTNGNAAQTSARN